MPTNWHFSAGEALGHAFSFFGRHLPVLCLFAFVVFAPLALYRLHVAGKVFALPPEHPFAVLGFWANLELQFGWIGRMLDLGLPLVLQATVTLGVFQYLKGGGRVQYGRSFAQGMRRILPVIGVALMIAFLIVAVGFVMMLLLVTVFSAAGAGMLGALVLVLAVLVIMVGLMCIFFVAVQAVVVERIGPVKAMARSAWLTSGARWKVFGILLVLGVLSFLGQWIVQQVAGESLSTFADARTAILVQTAVSAILSLFTAVCAAVIYHDLRKAKEGVGVEELLQVFA